MTPDRISELRALLAKATPGPWQDDPDDSTIEAASGGAVCHMAHHANTHTILSRGEEWSHANATLIVAAVNSLGALLDDYERLRDNLILIEQSVPYEEITANPKLYLERVLEAIRALLKP